MQNLKPKGQATRLPIILPNAVTFFLSSPLLMMKLRYRESVKDTKTGRL